jgi:hypothetical protein
MIRFGVALPNLNRLLKRYNSERFLKRDLVTMNTPAKIQVALMGLGLGLLTACAPKPPPAPPAAAPEAMPSATPTPIPSKSPTSKATPKASPGAVGSTSPVGSDAPAAFPSSGSSYSEPATATNYGNSDADRAPVERSIEQPSSAGCPIDGDRDGSPAFDQFWFIGIPNLPRPVRF